MNLMQLSDEELTKQAVRLELAVHKLTNRGFDKFAEEYCERYGVNDVDDQEVFQLAEQQQQHIEQDERQEGARVVQRGYAGNDAVIRHHYS